MQIRRRFAVSIAGRFADEAVPDMKHRLERLGTTKIETYDVYPATEKLDAVANFHVETDVDEAALKASVAGMSGVNSVRAEEIDAKTN